MHNKQPHKPLAAAMGTALVATLAALPAVQASDNPFGMTQLSSGYMVADATKAQEGKCGEGKCGAADAKAKEGKCGAADAKAKEGKCGAADAKAKEGKCGEGKCGAKR